LVLGLSQNMEQRDQVFVVLRPLYFCTPRHESEQGVSFFVSEFSMFIDTVNKPEYRGPRFFLIQDQNIINQLEKCFLYSHKYLDDQTF